MVTVGMAVDMVVDMVLLQVTGKRTSLVRSRILNNLYPRSDIDEKFMFIG